MRIYLDDVRKTGDRSKDPESFTHRTYIASETIALLETGKVTHVSLDHDLDGDGELPSEECGTGYDVARWIEEAAYNNLIPRLSWEVHSMNPSGASKMRAALTNADRFWTFYEQAENPSEYVSQLKLANEIVAEIIAEEKE